MTLPREDTPILPFALGCAIAGVMVGGSVGAVLGTGPLTREFNRMLVQGYIGTAVGMIPAFVWWLRSRKGAP